jgi:hypothetical protein
VCPCPSRSALFTCDCRETLAAFMITKDVYFELSGITDHRVSLVDGQHKQVRERETRCVSFTARQSIVD